MSRGAVGWFGPLDCAPDHEGSLRKRILVTGGAGFIGSHVCERLLDDKHVVEIVDDLSTGKRENVASGATLHQADVRSPEAAAIIRDGRFDAIVHLAAQM